MLGRIGAEIARSRRQGGLPALDVRRGRLPLGPEATPVESVRLGPDLRDDVASQAEVEGVLTSGFIGSALGNDLFAAR